MTHDTFSQPPARPLDIVDGLATAASLEELWDLQCRTMAGFGFDRLIYGLTQVAGPDGSLGALDDALVLSNHDPAYFKRFISAEMFVDAPGMVWARNHAGAIGWGELWRDANALPPATRRIIAFNRAAGVVAGYTISFAQASPRSFAMVSLTGASGLSQHDLDTVWASHGPLIQTLSQVFHLRVQSLPHRKLGATLSDRQREVLEWVGDGKSCRDIATIMRVSVPTVEKHLRLAREKLRVSTTAQAVLKAAFQNQIHVLGDRSRGPPVRDRQSGDDSQKSER